jgi:hypothetical protein
LLDLDFVEEMCTFFLVVNLKIKSKPRPNKKF